VETDELAALATNAKRPFFGGHEPAGGELSRLDRRRDRRDGAVDPQLVRRCSARAADSCERDKQMALVVEVEAERGGAGRDVERLQVGQQTVAADAEGVDPL
jgi:hypothetical protein